MAGEVRVERGIYRSASGTWRVYVRVAGQLVPRRYPADWPLTKVRRARAALDIELRKEAEAPAQRERADPGTFAEDAARYLKAVRSMTTYKERVFHIGLWVEAFGPRQRDTIQPIEIDQVLEAWLADGYAGSTVRKRRTALMHLWSKLDGKGAPNPVRSSTLPDEAEAERRGLPFSMIRVILRLLRPSKTRARLAMMAFTGLAPRQIAGLRPGDVVTDGAAVALWVRRRKKGKGAAGFVKPLTAEGVAALRQFAAWDAWTAHGAKPYSPSSAYKTFQRAARDKLALGGLRPYDLRHSYVGELYAATGDLRATQLVAGHKSLATTARYALGAVDERVRVAVEALGARLKLPAEVTSSDK